MAADVEPAAKEGTAEHAMRMSLLARAKLQPMAERKRASRPYLAWPEDHLKQSPEGATLEKSLHHKPEFHPKEPKEDSKGNLYNTGYLSSNDTLKASWARYLSKFVDAYKTLGLDIWGLTLQNEPSNTVSKWPMMFMLPEHQLSFLVNHLGPTMRKNHPDVKLIIHDDSLTGLPDVQKLLESPEIVPYVDGVGYHWYDSIQSVYENTTLVKPSSLTPNQVGGGGFVGSIWRKLQDMSPSKFVLNTEACNGYALGTNYLGPRPGEWGYGYSYSHDIMWQMLNGATGWTDWNMMLDSRGGPNLAGNFVDSAVVFEGPESFLQNPSFFHLAHFAKYVTPGSTRVDLNITCGLKDSEHCQAVGFLRPDGNAVVVLTNDNVDVGPVVEPSIRAFVYVPKSATGTNKEFSWSIGCGPNMVSGVAPWRSIQTIILPCQ
mmetsp:Transcript_50529/g.156377  ORF Transcript_50529/g.156377 Transcript_50529/m.156377 type:complete len:431 (-) Transcript_50529:92-1384(-)